MKYVWWILAVAIMGTALVVKGQPATQPAEDDGPDRPVDEVTSFLEGANTFANKYQQVTQALRWKEDDLQQALVKTAGLEQQVARLAAQAWSPYNPATPMLAGGSYVLPEGLTMGVTVNVDGVRLYGPPGKTVWPGDGTYIVVKKGVTGTIIEAFALEPPEAFSGKGRFVQDEGNRTTVRNCTARNIHTFVNSVLSSGLCVDRCEAYVKGAAVYMGGVKGAVVRDGKFRSSHENTLRASPQKIGNTTVYQPCEDVAILNCESEQTGGKAAVEIRHCYGAVVAFNTRLKANPDHAAVGIGDKDAGDGDPGSRDVHVFDNFIDTGTISVHEGVDVVTVERNRFFVPKLDETIMRPGSNPPKPMFPGGRPNNQAIFIDATAILKDLRVVHNTGTSPVVQKPMVGYLQGVKPPNLVEHDNVWTVVP